jgi:hypothetical protein
VKLILEALAVWGALRLHDKPSSATGAHLLAFVAAHPATAQEVRDQVNQVFASLPPLVQHAATAWQARRRWKHSLARR